MLSDQMRRRDFITLLGGAAAAWPLAARAQQPGKLPTIGFLGSGTPSAWSPWTGAFVQRLRELGWIEGRTVAIEYRWAEGSTERFGEIAAEFVQLKVDVIVTTGAAALAAKQTTSVIPIVFAVANDPIGSGLVAGLARPGGNLTGLSVQARDLAGKRLEFFLEVVTLEVRRAEDIAPAFEALKGRAQALYVVTADPLLITNRIRINTLANIARLPMITTQREFVETGGLMSYGPNYSSLFHHAADYVDKILRGAKPADIPVEQPTKFDLVINLTTAKALGLTIPESFLLRADEVIE